MEKGVFMVKWDDVSKSQSLRSSALIRIPRSPRWSIQLTTCQPPGPGARSSQFLELKEVILKNQQYEND